MRRRRSALAALLACLSALLLSACQGWLPGGSASGPGIQLTYALWDPHEEIGYQKSIAEFERLHPDIHVTFQLIPYANYEQKVTAEFVAHEAPDVFWVNTPFLAQWVQDGLLTNLSPRIHAAHIDLGQYYPSLVKLHEHDGKIYGLPKDWDTIGLYYNRNYFAAHHVQIPSRLTWTPDGGGTFTQLLQQLTVDRSGRSAAQSGFDPGQIATYGVDMPNDPQSGYGNYVAMNGGSILPRPYATSVSLQQPSAVQALTYMTNLIQKQHLAVPAAESGPNGDGSLALTLFSEGRIAMFETGDWQTTTILQSVNFKVGVLPLPAGPDGRVSVFNGLIDGINSQSPHMQAAWELEQWLGSARSERILGQGGYIWPGIRSLDPLFLHYWQAKGIDLSPFLDEAQGKVVNFPVSPSVGGAITDLGLALGPAFLGSSSVPAAVRNASAVADHDLQSPS